MSRKHFEAIAAALRASGASDETIEAVASALSHFNPSFDRRRFTNASRPLFEVVYSDGSKLYSGPDFDGKPIIADSKTGR